MKKFAFLIMTVIAFIVASAEPIIAQSVPQGIHYQAVARDNTGKEMSEKTIDVRFSIISGNPLNTAYYQELHSGVRTSKYGVFTLIIGSGVNVGGTIENIEGIRWGEAPHYLKVEIKFENDFVDMGTMQFLSVPYALFAGKSLEPGPTGPTGPTGPQGAQGPPGDPASDKQTLSFNGNILTISGSPGNWVDLSALINDADADPKNEIQDLAMTSPHILKITGNTAANPIDLSTYDQRLLWNSVKRKLVITNSTDTIDLSRVLSFNSSTNALSISGGNTIDLTSLKNDADASTTNELITSVAVQGSELVITEAGTERRVDLSSNMIAFRAKKLASSIASIDSHVPLSNFTEIYPQVGSGFSPSAGVFIAPITGIYTFNVSYYADGTGSSRKLTLYLNSEPYEDIALDISSGATISTHSVTMLLVAGNDVKLMIYTGLSSQTGTATFSGFRVF